MRSMHKPTKLRAHLLYVLEAGGDAEAILAGSGVSAQSVMELRPLEDWKSAELLDLLAERTPDDFAICSGLATRFEYLGILGFRLSNCRSFGELLRTANQYWDILDYPLAGRIGFFEKDWRIDFTARYPMSDRALRLCLETTLAGLVPALRRLTGHRLTFSKCGFPFRAPEDVTIYRKLEIEGIVFNQPCGFLSGPVEELGLKLSAVDGQVRALSEEYCRTALQQTLDEDHVIERLTTLFVSCNGRFPTADAAAHLLGCSLRTLHRRLARRGESYHDLLNRYRRELSSKLLEQGASAKVVAFRLGYSDARSFRRAFASWQAMPTGIEIS